MVSKPKIMMFSKNSSEYSSILRRSKKQKNKDPSLA